MGAVTRALPTLTIVSLLALSGCGSSGGGADVTPTSKSITVSGTVQDGSTDAVAPKSSAKAKAVPAGGCPTGTFTVRVRSEETCSTPLGQGIHEYEITSDVPVTAANVVVHIRRAGFPPSSQSIVLSGDGETVAPTFAPRVYDKREAVNPNATVTVQADGASENDGEPDATIEIQAGTTEAGVSISVLSVSPSDSDDAELLPGEQVDSDGQELKQLTAVEITLSDDDGNEVQPADGKPIAVTLKLPPAAVASINGLIASGTPPDGLQVDWRSFDEQREVWVDEDADPATPGTQGAQVLFEDDAPIAITAFISHLTWYAAGEVVQPSEQGCLAITVEDSDGNPLDDVVIKLAGEGEAFGDQAITNSAGITYVDSLISTDSKTRTVSISVVRDGSTVAQLTGQNAPITGGVSAEQTTSCDLGPVVTINVEGTVTGTVVRGFQRNPAVGASVFIESTDEGVSGLARATAGAAGGFTFTLPTPFNFEVFAGGDNRTGTLAAAAVNADAGELFLGNTAPNNVAIDAASLITAPGGNISLTGVGSDIDRDSLSYSWTTTNGALSSAAGETVSWTAPDSPFGSTVITLTISDGELSTTATLTLNWDEINVAPTIDQISSSNEGSIANSGTALITAIASDANSEDTITYSWTTSVGSIGTGTEAVTFTAPTSGFGSATITLEVSDGEFTVSDTFTQGYGTPPNQPPIIASTSRAPEGNVTRGIAVDVSVSASDPDSSPSPLTYNWTSVSGSFNSATDGTTAQWVAPSAVGSFEITVTVSDGEDSDSETLVVVVVNNTPVITSVTSSPTGTVAKSASVDLSSVASDPDGDAITYQWTADSGSFNGSADQETAEWTASDAGGTANITLTVSDGLLSDSESISLTVSSNAPVINSLTADPSGDVQRNTAVALTSDVTDPDGDDVTYEWTANIGDFNGSITDPAASWLAPNDRGNAVITLTVTDGEFSSSDTLEFAVSNVAPSAVDDIASTNVGKSVLISVLANDSDDDGDALTLEEITVSATRGTATIIGDQVQYQPGSEFIGTDTFSYSISDGFETATADVAVTVTEVQAAAFGEFNALYWASSFESDGRFGNNDHKRLAYYSGLYAVNMLDNGGGDVDFRVVGSNAEYDIELNTSPGNSSIDSSSEQEADLDLEQYQASTSNGAVYVHIPFEEEGGDSDGDYAEVGLPEVLRLLPAGDDNYIGADFFQQLSTLRPVVSDLGFAVNAEQTFDEDHEPSLQLYTRRSDSFGVASLDGDYGLVTHVVTLNPNGDKGIASQVEVVSLSSGSGSSSSMLVAGTRGSSSGFETSNFAEGLGSGESREYAFETPADDMSGRIQGTAQLRLDSGSETALALDGYADPSGTLFTVITPSEFDGSSDTVEVHQALTRGVRLGSGIVDGDLIGKTYNLTLSAVEMSEGSDSYETETISSVRMRFDAEGKLSFFCGSETLVFVAGRDDDLSPPFGETGECHEDDEGSNVTTGTWSLASDRGELTLTQSNTDSEFLIDMRGFISENLGHLVMAEYEEYCDGICDGNNGSSSFLSSIVIGSLAGEDRFDNVAPEISVNAGITSSIKLSHGESIALEANVSDADGDVVSVEWFAAGAGSFSADAGVSTLFTAPSHGHGSTQIFAAARDGKLVSGISMSVEFGPGYAAGATAEQHAAAAQDIDDNLQNPEDVRGFFAGFNPRSETGTCLPYDSNDDTNETTGTQTRTHVDSAGADATGMDLQVGDVIQLTYFDCLEDDDFDDTYSDGTVTFTMMEVPSSSGDGEHTHAWTTEWDFASRELDGDATHSETITGDYTVTQTSEELGGEVESLTTRVEVLSGQELRADYDGGGSYGFDEGVLYLREGTVFNLEESEVDWSFAYDVFFTEYSTEMVERTDANFFTVAPLVGKVLQGGLENETEYSLASAGIARSEFSTHPTASFDGIRVVVLDVQYNDPDASSFPESDMFIYLIEDWDGMSADFEQVAVTSYAIIENFDSAPEGEAYVLLPPSFDGQKYRSIELGRGFEVRPSIVVISADAEIVNFGLADDFDTNTVEAHFGVGIDRTLNLDSRGGFSTNEDSDTYVEDERDVLTVENGNILASFDSEFTLHDVCSVTNETLATANNGAVYVSAYIEDCQGYGTAFVDGNPVGFDASDRQYNKVDQELILFIRGEENATNADLAGDYGMVTFLTTLGTGGSAYQNQVTMLKNVTLDANGDYLETTSVDANAFLMERDEDGGPFFVGVEEPAFAGVTDLDLDVQANGDVVGSFELANGDEGELDGAASVSSGLIAVAGFFDGEGTDRGLVEHILLKRNTSPVLNNTQWLVQGIAATHDFSNTDDSWSASGVLLDDVANMVIDGAGNITWSGVEYESRIDISKPDGDTFIEINEDEAYSINGVVEASPNAGDVALSFSESDSDTVLEGYQSQDGSMMVMRIKGQDDGSGTEGFVFTGVYVLVRNDAGNVPNVRPNKGLIHAPAMFTAGTTAELTISGVVDPEAKPIGYTWYASVGSFTTNTASSVERDGIQVIYDAGDTVTWHAPASGRSSSALIRAEATDGERYSTTDITILQDI